MTDGLGSKSYVYDQLSRMTSETRTFTGDPDSYPPGSYTLSYAYNPAGQLTSITNHSGAQVGYSYDDIGRPTNVSGSGYAGVSSYVNSTVVPRFWSEADGLQQRPHALSAIRQSDATDAVEHSRCTAHAVCIYLGENWAARVRTESR